MLVARDQIGIYFFYFFSNEAKLPTALGVKIFLVAESNGLQRKDRFACLVHWLDGLLETCRGSGGAGMPTGIDNHTDASRHRDATNASDICIRLGCRRSDSDCSGLACYTFVAEINIVTTGGEIIAGCGAYRDIASPAVVVTERIKTNGRVVAAGGVAKERVMTGGRVVVSGGVVKEG